MHDVLRTRLLRTIESLPEDQVYQVLDYIEFLQSKYAPSGAGESSGLQRFAENLEDKLRKKALSPSTLREAFQLISAADRVLSGVSNAGKKLLNELGATEDERGGESAGALRPSDGRPRPGDRGEGPDAERGGAGSP
ncbi:MAG: DUF2281 domain-containing protein [Gemmatimonadota bacterium]